MKDVNLKIDGDNNEKLYGLTVSLLEQEMIKSMLSQGEIGLETAIRLEYSVGLQKIKAVVKNDRLEASQKIWDIIEILSDFGQWDAEDYDDIPDSPADENGGDAQ